jgi:hypothetical protein
MTARLQLRSVDGNEREIPLETAAAGDVSAAAPWRTFRSHRNQRHYSGWYWSSTTGDHVIYESRLELVRLLLADADPDIVGIAAQPFLLIEGTETKPRRHVPDFFLQHRNGRCTVVNVKPAGRLKDPKVAATLEWAGMAITAKGWVAEVWTGCDPLLLTNVRFSPATGGVGCSIPPRSTPPKRRSSKATRSTAFKADFGTPASTNLGRSCSTCFGRDAPALS